MAGRKCAVIRVRRQNRDMHEISLYIFNTFIIIQTTPQGKEEPMTLWTPTDDGHADLTSHDTFLAGAPHNTFARLRRDDPMHWTD